MVETEKVYGLPQQFSSKDESQQICYLCGDYLDENKTEDHLPPKLLFPKNDRVKCLIVYACNKCHPKRYVGMDDEYFRDCLIDLVGKENMDLEVVRARERAHARKPLIELQSLLNRKVESVQLDSGLLLPMMRVTREFHRMASVVERIGKGFHFSRWKRRIRPVATEVFVQRQPFVLNKRDRLISRIAPSFELIKDKFEVKFWSYGNNGKEESCWFFTFYKKAVFFVKFDMAK